MSSKSSDSMVITVVCVLAVALLLYMLLGCRMKCSSFEGYRPGELPGYCNGLMRSPVDFAMKGAFGYQSNPHYQQNPSNRFQPLEQGPIDFYFDERKLDPGSPFGEVFGAFNPDYAGSGRDLKHIENDSHNRFNLTNIGALGMRNYMDNIWDPSFGPYGFQDTEQRRVQVNPYFDKIYGGRDFLTHDKIGN